MCERLEKECKKEEAMIVCVFAQDFARLYRMQVDLLEKPKCMQDINSYFNKFGCIVDKVKVLGVDVDNKLYKKYQRWAEFNGSVPAIENSFSKLTIGKPEIKQNIEQKQHVDKQSIYNNANYNALQQKRVYIPQRNTSQNTNTDKPKMSPSFLPPKQAAVQQSTPSFVPSAGSRVQDNNQLPSRPKMTYGQINQQQVKNVLGSPMLQRQHIGASTANTNRGQSNLAPSSALRSPIPSTPTMNQRPIPSAPVMAQRPIPSAPIMNLRPVPSAPITNQGPVPSAPVMNPRPVPSAPVINQRPAPSSPVMHQRPVPSSPVAPPKFTPAPGKPTSVASPMPNVNNQQPSASTPRNLGQNMMHSNPQYVMNQSHQPHTNTSQNNVTLSDSQKNELLNLIQKKINFLITESNKKNGFFHKNKITSSMKRLQFYEINKENFTDELIIHLNELLSMIDEEGNVSMLEKFKVKVNELNSTFGSFCGVDVFGLGLLGLYQVVLSDKK